MRVKMSNKSALLFIFLVVSHALVVSVSSYEDQRGRGGWEREEVGLRSYEDERGRRGWEIAEEGQRGKGWDRGRRGWERQEEGGRGRPEWEREQEGGREWEREEGRGGDEREWERQEEGGRGMRGREQEKERGRPEWEREQGGGREWEREPEGRRGREQEKESGRPEWEREREGGREWERQEGGRGREWERGRPKWEREQEGGREWEREEGRGGDEREWERQQGGRRGRKGREQEKERGRPEWQREQEGGREWEREREQEGGREWEREEGRGGDDEFLLQDSKHVVRTDAGDMRVVKGFGGQFTQNPMHIGFITMEPNSLFIPQYIDANLILFVNKGEARLGYIYEDELAEKQLRNGDVYRIPAGSAFYLVNTAEGQRLHIICSIDTTDSIGWKTFQSFFIGGGNNPTSVLSGFDPLTISTAFNVSIEELRGIMTKQRGGPIVYLTDTHAPSKWSKFLDSSKEQRLSQLKSVVPLESKTTSDQDEQSKWSWRKLMKPFLGEENKKKEKGTTSTGPDSYNLYDRDPDFKNDYGWSMALDEEGYSPLTHSGIGVYLVNLTAGSMMAPHVNPTATEYGIVLKGSGTLQVVHPNGSSAMKAEVNEGDVFWVPRYFPFCQIASRSGPFEFFGFTTSARRNRPQFLVGANSLLQTMMGPELAAAFGVSEERLRNVTAAQRESVILPSASASPAEVMPRSGEEEEGQEGQEGGREREIPKVIKNLGGEMIVGFD